MLLMPFIPPSPLVCWAVVQWVLTPLHSLGGGWVCCWMLFWSGVGGAEEGAGCWLGHMPPNQPMLISMQC